MNETFKQWDDFAKDSLVSMAQFFVEEGHNDFEYKFAERSIILSISFLNNKRKDKENDKKTTLPDRP